MNREQPISLNSILKRIADGEPFDDSDLLPFLTKESKRERCRVNLGLAEAFYARHARSVDRDQSLRRARDCAARAFLLSRYTPEALPALLRADATLGDAAGAAEALKRVGLEHARRGQFAEALGAFDRWAYADAEFAQTDLHAYDPDVLDCIERMASLYRFNARTRARENRPMRVAYLMQGLTESNSILVKIDQNFARLHDRTRVEPAYFSVDSEAAVMASADGRAAVEEFARLRCPIIAAPDCELLLERLLAVGAAIRDFEPDILVTAAALASFRNYFVSSLRPAPVTVSLHQGPSAQYTWHDFDHAISWFSALIPDCPADCSLVPLELGFPAPGEVTPAARAELEVPENATLIVSGGRWPKFQSREYWRVMSALLEERADLYWLVMGFGEAEVPFLSEVLTPAARARVRFRGWRRDYLGFVAAADMLLDSYPAGGGALILDALALGLPAISFTHDYVAAYNNNDCSGGEELVVNRELVLARGDFDVMKRRIAGLVENPGYRRKLGAELSERVRRERGEPERMVRRCEEIYERVLQRVERERTEAAPTFRRELAAGDADESGEAAHEAFRLRLIERERALNAREVELRRREARLDASLPLRLERALRWRWRLLTGRGYLGYPE